MRRNGTLSLLLAAIGRPAVIQYGRGPAVLIFDDDLPNRGAMWELHHLTDYRVTSLVSGPGRVLSPIVADDELYQHITEELAEAWAWGKFAHALNDRTADDSAVAQHSRAMALIAGVLS